MSTELDKTSEHTLSSIPRNEEDSPSRPNFVQVKAWGTRRLLVDKYGVPLLAETSEDAFAHSYQIKYNLWFASHHGGYYLQEAAEHSTQHHQETRSRGEIERQLEILREKYDEQSTQIQFLQTRNAELRQSAAELRKAVARETQKFDQMQGNCVGVQQTVDKLVDSLIERGKASDCLISGFISRPDSHLRMTESYEGIVEDVDGDKVLVVYDVNGKIVEQTYEKSQFIDGRLPDVGTRLAVFVNVAEVQSKPVESGVEETKPRDEPANARRKPLRGTIEF